MALRNKTYETKGYLHTEMEVRIERLSDVLLELGRNEKIFGIDVHYIDSGWAGEAKAIIRFACKK